MAKLPYDKRKAITIIIPVLNQLAYTKKCLASLSDDLVAGVKVVVVDNGSDDGTVEFLAARDNLSVIRNEENLGCAAAWNQGVMAATAAEWIAVLNNDVLVADDWLRALLDFAEKQNIDIVSPAMREGELNYDLEGYARSFVSAMKDMQRPGTAHGACFVVRRRVFETIGLFDENFRIGQFEDTDFFLRARRAGFRLAITGAAFIHHFGSVTQDSITRSRSVRPYEVENRAYFREKWRMGWWRRRKQRLISAARTARWRQRELRQGGHSLNEKWIGGRLVYY
uniref:Glycosyltransferase, GT2 family n=1 Tax=Candidatus Kentrum sp. DK TaxID=2126562 RepID=A0A450T5S7_9GAMM|nr:MAG: Glycosyltransferase, GT2 family [Candidatus Kentron sp. DK]